MSTYEKVSLKGESDYSLSLFVFESPNAVGTIQMVHGMEEHKERYVPFAEFLSDNGFNVVISDLRGHGEDAPLLSHIADKGGEELLIKDQQLITKYIKDRFKGLKVYLFGHSMGTIISRVLLQTDSREYEKVALSGYVCPNPASPVAVALGNVIRAVKKPKGHSAMLTNLALGPYVKAVKDSKTPCDWLSYNEENVKKYIDDPLCGVEFTTGSYSALFHLLNKMGKAGCYVNINADLPFLLIGGEDDPCTGGEKGRADSKALLEKAGFKNISVITYPMMRHEILNEDKKEKVYQDILDFFK